MTNSELESLLDDIESDRAERKESALDGEKIRQALCAFANDLPNHGQPGVLFIGVDDKGSPTGLEITDQLLQTLASMRGDGNILPFISMDVQKRQLKGKDVAVAIVYPSSATPVKFKGVIWIRIGPRRGWANKEDERRLEEKRRSRDLPPDIRPIAGVGIDAIDELLFSRSYLPSAVAPEALEQNDRTLEEQLLASKFAHFGPPTCVTVLGVLTVGKSPTDYLPCAYIQFVRFSGAELSDHVTNQKEIRAALPDLVSETEDLIKANLQLSVDFTSGPTERRVADYPFVAIQQVARNSILHRTYENTNAPVKLYWFEDRIEFHNPGGPFGRVTKDNFGTGINDYRNPNLAAVMKELGYVQRFGVGITVARNEMRKNGNPAPEFQVEDGYVTVILRKRP
jgi:ATP-dependent DNA helicase RecG